MNSFGTAPRLPQGIISLHPWNAAGPPGKFMCQRFSWDKGDAHAWYHDGFHDLGTFDEAPGTAQSPGVRADAQCCKIDVLKWLEELVSQSNTIQAQEDITEQGRLHARSG